MKPRSLAAIVALCLIAAVAACSSPAAKSPAIVVAPSPTPSTATLLQYASGLNASIKDYEDAWHNYSTDCAVGAATAFSCYAEVSTIHFTAMTIDEDFTNLSNPASSDYVGPPPAAIVKLIATTHTDIQPVATDSEDGQHPGALLLVEAGTLDNDCQAWDPYLAG